MSREKSQKNCNVFFCEICNYETLRNSDFNKHKLTRKHEMLVNASKMLVNASKSRYLDYRYNCDCGKTYCHESSYYRHKKTCSNGNNNGNNNGNISEHTNENITENNNNKASLKNDKELIMLLIKENMEMRHVMMKVIENGTHHTTNNINSHNKAFNLNFFLNETCKNAMNISEFIDSIKLQMNDLMQVGELGYVQGISKIIIKNLNKLDETERPIHCTDKKREIFYIKDQDKWEKDNAEKQKIKNTIKTIANKNIILLPQFRNKFPDYNNSMSKISDKYEKIVIEVMVCNDVKDEKIIKNISKATIINK